MFHVLHQMCIRDSSYMTLEGETFLWKTLEGEVYRELEL